MIKPHLEAIKIEYAKRATRIDPKWYSIIEGDVLARLHEKQKVILSELKNLGFESFDNTKLLEIGCGNGGNLQDFIRFGFLPKNIYGNDLIEERIKCARALLPAETKLHTGNACDIDLAENTIDIVYQSMVLSSILDDSLRENVCAKSWSLVKPGGIMVSYDFVYNNPYNKKVRKVTKGDLLKNFPGAKSMIFKRVTLAPPISRKLCRGSYFLYSIFNLLPILRSHLIMIAQK